MSCTFSDITLRERVTELVMVIDQVGDTLTAEQRQELADIGVLLDSLPPISVDDQLHALREGLEEIRDRE